MVRSVGDQRGAQASSRTPNANHTLRLQSDAHHLRLLGRLSAGTSNIDILILNLPIRPPTCRHLLHVVAEVRAPGRDGGHGLRVVLQLRLMDPSCRRRAEVDALSRLFRGGVASPHRYLLEVKVWEATRHDEVIPSLHRVFTVQLLGIRTQITPVLLLLAAAWRKRTPESFRDAGSVKNTNGSELEDFRD